VANSRNDYKLQEILDKRYIERESEDLNIYIYIISSFVVFIIYIGTVNLQTARIDEINYKSFVVRCSLCSF
jgi:hypothetical protein